MNLIEALIMLYFSSMLIFLFPYRNSLTNISSLRSAVLQTIFFIVSKTVQEITP